MGLIRPFAWHMQGQYVELIQHKKDHIYHRVVFTIPDGVHDCKIVNILCISSVISHLMLVKTRA